MSRPVRVAVRRRLLAWARLVRLPNLFTAPPDVLAGWALSTQRPVDETLLMVVLGSVSLYAAGMIWNDYFDVEEDRRDRPGRPLPSGAIPTRSAAVAASIGMAVGVGCCGLVSPSVGIVALCLAGCILLYDSILKQTVVAPVIMGTCRSLNVLLGIACGSGGQLSNLLETPFQNLAIGMALANGAYITGVTLFARHEASERAGRRSLIVGSVVMIVSVAGMMMTWGRLGGLQPWHGVLGSVAAARLVYSLLRAIRRPEPRWIQLGVKNSILLLIVWNSLSAGAAGWPTLGWVILLHAIPAWTIGRWLYST